MHHALSHPLQASKLPSFPHYPLISRYEVTAQQPAASPFQPSSPKASPSPPRPCSSPGCTCQVAHRTSSASAGTRRTVLPAQGSAFLPQRRRVGGCVATSAEPWGRCAVGALGGESGRGSGWTSLRAPWSVLWAIRRCLGPFRVRFLVRGDSDWRLFGVQARGSVVEGSGCTKVSQRGSSGSCAAKSWRCRPDGVLNFRHWQVQIP